MSEEMKAALFVLGCFLSTSGLSIAFVWWTFRNKDK